MGKCLISKHLAQVKSHSLTVMENYANIRHAQCLASGLTFSAAYGTSKGLGLRDANILDEWVYPLRKWEYLVVGINKCTPSQSFWHFRPHKYPNPRSCIGSLPCLRLSLSCLGGHLFILTTKYAFAVLPLAQRSSKF
jgi:hypothetical protein